MNGGIGVLVIDVQNVYLPGQKWACVSMASALDGIRRLCAGVGDLPVVFTRYIPFSEPQGVWKEYNRINAEVNADRWLNELTDDMKAAAAAIGAPVVDKPWYSAWKSSEVRELLSGVETVVVAGVVADCCVLSTVFDLIDAGKYVVYLKDAVSGVSRETEEAAVKVLEGLEYVHLRLTTTAEFLRDLHQGTGES